MARSRAADEVRNCATPSLRRAAHGRHAPFGASPPFSAHDLVRKPDALFGIMRLPGGGSFSRVVVSRARAHSAARTISHSSLPGVTRQSIRTGRISIGGTLVRYAAAWTTGSSPVVTIEGAVTLGDVTTVVLSRLAPMQSRRTWLMCTFPGALNAGAFGGTPKRQNS